MERRLLIIMLLLLGAVIKLQAQDLGVVWQKSNYTTTPSDFNNIIPQSDGTYLAVGAIAKNGKNVGYIVNVNESGEVITGGQPNEYVFEPDNAWPEWNTGNPWAYITQAYFTSDNHIIAFGAIKNRTCDISLKGFSLSGEALATSEWLKRGIWVVKINRTTGAVVYNNLERGDSEVNGSAVYQEGEKFLIIGMDYYVEGGINYHGLIRLYDRNGAWLYDNYQAVGGQKVNYSWGSVRGRNANGDFYISTDNRVMVIDKNTFANKGNVVTALALDAAGSCVLSPTSAITYPMQYGSHSFFSAKPDGGFIVMTRMTGLRTSSSPHTVVDHGFVNYEKNALNQLLYCNTINNRDTPVDRFYYAPFLLPGSTSEYIGFSIKVLEGQRYTYTYKVNAAGTPGTITDGPKTPYNTIISCVSLTDGFFTVGFDPASRTAAIAKLSTCVNFKTPDTTGIYIPLQPAVNLTKTLRYQGAKAASASGVQYKLEVKVAKGIVNGQTAGAVLETIPWTNVTTYTVSGGSASGNAVTLNRNYIIGSTHDAELDLVYTLKDEYVTAGVPQECNQTYVIKVKISKVSSTLFSDDVWFFGQNTGVNEGVAAPGNPKTSKGIIFKNESGVMVPHDASGVSKVNSWENSLSVSTPACDGSFIFYTQHDMLYNSAHENMKNGAIAGHTSTGDGLAAAYLGDNKYFFASVSTAGQGDLNYNIIDMSKENGLGEKLAGGVIDNSGLVAEAIEMIPVVGTYNQYWLIYYLRGTHNKIVVKKVDGTNPSAPVITDAGSLSTSVIFSGVSQNLWQMRANPSYTMLAVNSGSTVNNQAHHFFNFDPLTGAISFNRSLSTRAASYSSYSSYVFHNGYLYISESQAHADAYYIYQYKLSSWALVSSYKVTNTPASAGGSQNWQGGGMKMGPDGKIYFIRQSSYYTGVIHNPDLLLTTPGNVDENGFRHAHNGMGIAMSTGLTPPWINPPSSNQTPVTVNDVALGNQYDSIRVNPLLNDTDDGGQANLNLTGAGFVTPTDAALGDIVWKSDTKEVIFVPKSPYPLQKDTTIYLNYTVRDSGIPVALCEIGQIAVTIKYTKVNSNLFSDDVWFFGRYESGVQTSKAMVFKNEGGVMVPYDYTPINGGKSSKVNSTENSLSVSTPACNGSFIFYTQHDSVYNSMHEPMEGGSFAGDNSNSDGLAACYIGNNKYILFAVSKAEVVPGAVLNYYYIDMSQNNGLGKMTYGGVVDAAATTVNEAIELIPKVGTYDKYWLVYHDATNITTPVNGKLKVIEIDGSQSNPIGNIVCEIQAPGALTYYGMRSNTTFDRIVINVRDGGLLPIYKFNPTNGQISHMHTITDRHFVYGSVFSPNSEYLYAVPYNGVFEIRQYKVETGALVGSAHYTTSSGGGGMKLGPDGKIYIVRNLHEWMAVIENPDVAFSAPGGGITINGFKLSHKGSGYEPSTGLTPPWVNPPTSNTAPIAVDDAMSGTQYDSIRVKPLLNDTDDGSMANLNLTGAGFITPSDAALGDIVWKSDTKEVIFVPKFPYPIAKDTTIYITYSARDQGAPVSMCDDAEIAVTINYTKVSSTLFSDDVWFFGQNADGDKTSKGILFENVGGVMVPKDFSNISKVNSRENSLSVSTPACNGSFIFYAQHNKVFNANHVEMVGGSFEGHTSNSDGLAAAYIGDNKYMLISVTTEADAGQLKYYIIDMNLQNGLGQMFAGGVVDNSNKVGEAIELMPKVGTFDEYWLIYYRSDLKKFIVYLIKGNNGTPVLTKMQEYASMLTPGVAHIYDLKSNGDYNTIAALMSNETALFKFNPLTGDLSHEITFSPGTLSSNLYSAEFSPNGKYLYLADIWPTTGTPSMLLQYDITNLSSPVYVNSVAYSQNKSVAEPFPGGSIKLGPDGKMYLLRSSINEMAVVSNPNAPLTAASINLNGFTLSSTGAEDLHISVGLTPPWINPTSSNQVPVTVNDSAICTLPSGVVISPLVNDSDPDGHSLYMSAAGFVNDADTVKGTVTWNGTTKTVTFTPKNTYPFANGEVVRLYYVTKDNGVPVALCEDGEIVVTILFPMDANDDVAYAFPCTTAEIDVAQNDIVPAGSSFNIVAQGVHGSASFVGNKLHYTITGSNCCEKGGLTDTVKYAICINGNVHCDSAIAVIHILSCSEIVLNNNCSAAPEMMLSKQYVGTYTWEYSADNVTWGTALPQYTDVNCTEVVPGYYRATIVCNGVSYTTEAKKLVIIRKVELPGGIIWYEMDLL